MEDGGRGHLDANMVQSFRNSGCCFWFLAGRKQTYLNNAG